MGRKRRSRAREGQGRGSRTNPVVRVHLISFRRVGRPLDDDNLRAGCKALRDAIAAWLGLDDNEQFIAWEYSQHETRGREGTGVKIEAI